MIRSWLAGPGLFLLGTMLGALGGAGAAGAPSATWWDALTRVSVPTAVGLVAGMALIYVLHRIERPTIEARVAALIDAEIDDLEASILESLFNDDGSPRPAHEVIALEHLRSMRALRARGHG